MRVRQPPSPCPRAVDVRNRVPRLGLLLCRRERSKGVAQHLKEGVQGMAHKVGQAFGAAGGKKEEH